LGVYIADKQLVKIVMDSKVPEWENNIYRFMQKHNLFEIPLTDQKMLDKGLVSIISGNETIFLMGEGGMYLYQECKFLSEHEKEGIYKYVVWYCNNMI
jgi:hypothetical protein